MSGTLRQARPGDMVEIDELMKASVRDIFPAFYDADQTASSVVHIAHVDPQLIEDGTYFVIEEAGELIGCGGWSRREKLYSGPAAQEGRARLLDPAKEPARVRAMYVRSDRTRRGLGTRILVACEAAARSDGYGRLALMATLPGVELYRRYGFTEDGPVTITLPDGVRLPCVAMSKAID